MLSPFLILHVSDAHIGNPKFQLDSMEAFDTLFEDLRKCRSELGRPPDLIVFNGDLAYGQIPASALSQQYEQAKAWLNRMYDSVDSDAVASPILFVPGNHDVNRDVIGKDQISWTTNLQNPDDLYQEMQANSVQWRRYIERQAEWANFVRQFSSPAFKLNSNLNMSGGLVPQSNPSVGVVALNTAWASYTEKENGNLWLGDFQLQQARQLTKDFDFRIVATHHPVDWLNPLEKTAVEKKIHSDFHLHLHGHVHDQWFVPAEGHLRVQAGACYAGSKHKNAYSWIEIDFLQRTAMLHLRAFRGDGQSGWIPNIMPGKTNEQGIARVEALFLGSGKTIPSPRPPTGPSLKLKPSKPTEYSATNATSQTSAAAEPPPFSTLNGLAAYIQILEDHFSFRWEPGDYDQHKEQVVYWPIKLRKPTVIHAVQAYTAAGLQKAGAKVVLCLDNHGDVEYTIPAFSNRVRKWFENAAGDFTRLEIRTFKDMVSPERYHEVWDFLQRWYSDEKYQIKDILDVSKLWKIDFDPGMFSTLLVKTPKRLLTAPMVWTCLYLLLQEHNQASFLTLGGFDERALWHAWRDCLKQPCPVGHLYIPKLLRPDGGNTETPVHMAQQTNLYWDSKEDIRSALEEAITREDWNSPGRLIPWIFSGGVQLPRYLIGIGMALEIQSKNVSSPSDLTTAEVAPLLSAITSEAARAMF